MNVFHKENIQGNPGQEASSQGNTATGGLQEIMASSGISPRLWRLYAVFWLVCLFFPILSLIRKPLGTVPVLIALSGLATFVGVYLWVMWPYPLHRVRGRRSIWSSSSLLLLVITLLVSFLSLAYGNAFTWLFLGVSAICGVRLPARRAFWVVTGLTLLTLGVSVVASEGIAGTDWLQVIPLVLLVRAIGLDMTGLTRLARALDELNQAREELARQAVVEERLRMARDLHDLLGHSLSLITLKSELAGRLVENDTVQAAQEIQEVERVARQALREVRQAVAGYRQQSLADELDGARQILEAAGINCRIDSHAGILPPDIDTALAWTVREAVTNVIRHSRARQCLIRITNQDTAIRSEVINDGYREPHPSESRSGSGLSGLGERLAALEGTMEAGPTSFENEPGFRLKVEIPIRSNVTRKEVQ